MREDPIASDETRRNCDDGDVGHASSQAAANHDRATFHHEMAYTAGSKRAEETEQVNTTVIRSRQKEQLGI